jgi:hypothetical protein
MTQQGINGGNYHPAIPTIPQTQANGNNGNNNNKVMAQVNNI